MTADALKSAYNALLSKGRLSANPGQAALVARLSELQTSLTNAPHHVPNGLYIYGGVGTGKSRIADLFAATLPPEVSRRRAHFNEFMLDIHSRLHRAWSAPGYAGDPLTNIGREVRDEARVLCFDEFQVTDIADAMILQRLFTSIWAAGGVMVSTSNRHPDTLYENGLNRPLILPFIEQLKHKCELWKMDGDEDYRMSASGERVQTFFTDRRAFQAALESAYHGVEPRPRTLRVMMGRHLRVRAADPDQKTGSLVVHASFEELCEASLGAADYHALCYASSTIFLEGLRPLARNELDYARRLITLIDLAYESRTRVYCCSATPVEGVFAEIVRAEQERLGFAAAPRLQKMDVKRGGGSSSSMMSTFIGDTEWSATGLPASLAAGGAGETDVVFAIGRAVSRLHEMGSVAYGSKD
ncbi:hypothetical protein N0V82_003747 [Gnomoniopsis sp. IMI 355080]|nr:hypothetical protein N0V82_003747 [Gnomoniopsis sp. IMI 355080]